jgi:organic radical activating enzyme
MSKIKVSEVFYSLQGEGRFVGVPSVFLRTFGCNFTCSGFNMPYGGRSTEADEIAKTIDQYPTFESLPLANTGCDSYASWHPDFKHLSPVYTTDEIVDKMLALTPNNLWQQNNGNPVHLVITGGEPLLGWQRAYPDILKHERMRDLNQLTFETNGTQKISDEFRDFIFDEWYGAVDMPFGREITFSVSPKLSCSGESLLESIQPEIVAEYQHYGHVYLKFVVGNEEHFSEVIQSVDRYRAAGFAGPVYVMPIGGTVASYDENKFNVADAALKYGYYYSPRLHVDIWGNGWGK